MWWQPLRVVDKVKVLHVNLTPEPAREAEALKLLDGTEREQASRYRYPQHRRQFVLCRAGLRVVLCEGLGCENGELAFRTLEHGKPIAVLKGKAAPISFNLSHSGGHGLIALADGGRVGVDVEERCGRRDLDLIAESVFTEGERADLGAVEGAKRLRLFYRFWTIKEALIKALGTGLSLSPARFDVPSGMRRGGDRGMFEFPETATGRWRCQDLGDDRFAAAVAYELDAAQAVEGTRD